MQYEKNELNYTHWPDKDEADLLLSKSENLSIELNTILSWIVVTGELPVSYKYDLELVLNELQMLRMGFDLDLEEDGKGKFEKFILECIHNSCDRDAWSFDFVLDMEQELDEDRIQLSFANKRNFILRLMCFLSEDALSSEVCKESLDKIPESADTIYLGVNLLCTPNGKFSKSSIKKSDIDVKLRLTIVFEDSGNGIEMDFDGFELDQIIVLINSSYRTNYTPKEYIISDFGKLNHKFMESVREDVNFFEDIRKFDLQLYHRVQSYFYEGVNDAIVEDINTNQHRSNFLRRYSEAWSVSKLKYIIENNPGTVFMIAKYDKDVMGPNVEYVFNDLNYETKDLISMCMGDESCSLAFSKISNISGEKTLCIFLDIQSNGSCNLVVRVTNDELMLSNKEFNIYQNELGYVCSLAKYGISIDNVFVLMEKLGNKSLPMYYYLHSFGEKGGAEFFFDEED